MKRAVSGVKQVGASRILRQLHDRTGPTTKKPRLRRFLASQQPVSQEWSEITPILIEKLQIVMRMDNTAYSISSKIRNIGRYMATIIPPTMPPTTRIISGSMIDVSDFIVASTSDS